MDAPAKKEDLGGHQQHLLQHLKVWFSRNLLEMQIPHPTPDPLNQKPEMGAVIYFLTHPPGDSDAQCSR